MTYIPPPPVSDEGLPLPLQMTAREQALRDSFVAEYLIDYSATRACMRLGFPKEFAEEWAQKLMAEPYVQKKLAAMSLQKPADEKQEAEFERARVKNRLMYEAHYYGPGSSQAARVAALAQLTKIFGLEAAKKVDVNVKDRGGVMRAPGIADLNDWEQAASSSQDSLMRDAAS
jgi:hypothetical protein